MDTKQRERKREQNNGHVSFYEETFTDNILSLNDVAGTVTGRKMRYLRGRKKVIK